MNAPTRQWHPFGRTEEEDLNILNNGGDTGWSDDNGTPAPWPKDFLDPTTGWINQNTAHTGQNDAETQTENPPF